MAAPDVEADTRLFPTNSIVHIVIEISRCRKIYQHEDNSRKSSAFVESLFLNGNQVSTGWLESGDLAAEAEKELSLTPRRGKGPYQPKFSTTPANPLVGETKTEKENENPFFNHALEYVFTPNSDTLLDPADAIAKFRFRIVDSNIHPHPRPLTLAAIDVNFAKNTNKHEVIIACDEDPECQKQVDATAPFERTEMSELMTSSDENENADVWPDPEKCREGGEEGRYPGAKFDRGIMHIRWSCKVTKPKPPAKDPDADILLAKPATVLTGHTTVLPMPPEGEAAGIEHPGPHMTMPGVVLFSDPDFTMKLNKALIKILGAIYDEEQAAKSPKRRGGGGSFGGSMMNRSSNNNKKDEKEEDPTTDKVIVNYWKCKRSHQVMTKMRIAAEHCLKGMPALGFTPEEEQECKLRWKQQSALIQVGVLEPAVLAKETSGLYLMYQKLWVLIATGDEDPLEQGGLWSPSFEQRTKLQYMAWGPTQYCALQAALIKLVLPTLSDVAALEIAVEDFKSDDFAIEKMTPQPGSSRVVGSGIGSGATAASSSNTNPASSQRGRKQEDPLAAFKQACDALEKLYAPSRGDGAEQMFRHQMSDFLHRWAGTVTETEQAALLKATAPAMHFCRIHAGLITETKHSRRKGSAKMGRSRRRASASARSSSARD